MRVKRKDIAAVVAATFPEYTGRKFRVEVATSLTFYNLNYDGGSRNVYRAAGIDGTPLDGQRDMNRPMPWANPFEGLTVNIPDGFVVVEHTEHCGHDCGLTVHVNPANMPRLLPGVTS